MSLLFLERRNLGRDNKALSALAWGAVADSILPLLHPPDANKCHQEMGAIFSLSALGSLPNLPHLCGILPFFLSSADLAFSPMT